jgi:transcriptional regulator with XRE-family HTH domain
MDGPEIVRGARHGRDWSQEQLAHEAGVALRSVQRIEAGGSPSLDVLHSVCEALGLPIELRAALARPDAWRQAESGR